MQLEQTELKIISGLLLGVLIFAGMGLFATFPEAQTENTTIQISEIHETEDTEAYFRNKVYSISFAGIDPLPAEVKQLEVLKDEKITISGKCDIERTFMNLETGETYRARLGGCNCLTTPVQQKVVEEIECPNPFGGQKTGCTKTTYTQIGTVNTCNEAFIPIVKQYFRKAYPKEATMEYMAVSIGTTYDEDGIKTEVLK